MVAIDTAIQNLLDDINRQVGPQDFVQLCLDAPGLIQPLFSLRKPWEDLNTADFLNNIVSVLQSNTELVEVGTLRLVVTIIRNRAGGGSVRALKTIIYSKIIEKKKRKHLLNLHNQGNNLCLPAASWACYRVKNSDMPNY